MVSILEESMKINSLFNSLAAINCLRSLGLSNEELFVLIALLLDFHISEGILYFFFLFCYKIVAF